MAAGSVPAGLAAVVLRVCVCVWRKADCAAAPSLYYADRIVPLRAGHPVLGAYLNRLEARPSFARVLREMQPWWQNFPFASGPLAS